ncbi:hypothetical protein [Clostridium sp. KNHs214]|uniref:hypothetical protein n=1 Tax=Clostridium sp. KNHs214 TaxID=1540257 RepID=UPI0005571193|nr:hypothetical protein [Clostridium sp. KNHs214]
MNKKSKLIIIVSIVLCIILFCFFRYKKINNNVAKTYEKQEYSIGENIHLDNLDLVVKSYKFIQYNKDDNVDVLLELNLKNTSKKTVDASSLIYNSKLAAEFEYVDTPSVEKQDLSRLKKLQPNHEISITFKYSVLARTIKKFKNKTEFKFYIANDLYKEDIIKKYKELKLYSKYVYLKS